MGEEDRSMDGLVTASRAIQQGQERIDEHHKETRKLEQVEALVGGLHQDQLSVFDRITQLWQGSSMVRVLDSNVREVYRARQCLGAAMTEDGERLAREKKILSDECDQADKAYWAAKAKVDNG